MFSFFVLMLYLFVKKTKNIYDYNKYGNGAVPHCSGVCTGINLILDDAL